MNITHSIRKFSIRKFAIAGTLSILVAFSTNGFADEKQKKLIDAIKNELSYHSGIIGGYDPESGIITLSGYTDNKGNLQSIISKLESLDGVSEVRSSVF